MNPSPEHRLEDLLDGLYEDLRREAQRQLGSQTSHTLQPTALLNEALVRLLTTRERAALSERQLCVYLAKVMRSVLVDHARAKAAAKRGGGGKPVPIEELGAISVPDPSGAAVEVLAVHAALEQLAASHPDLAELAELRYFGGLSVPEVARAKGVSEGRVKAASLYLRRCLEGEK